MERRGVRKVWRQVVVLLWGARLTSLTELPYDIRGHPEFFSVYRCSRIFNAVLSFFPGICDARRWNRRGDI